MSRICLRYSAHERDAWGRGRSRLPPPVERPPAPPLRIPRLADRTGAAARRAACCCDWSCGQRTRARRVSVAARASRRSDRAARADARASPTRRRRVSERCPGGANGYDSWVIRLFSWLFHSVTRSRAVSSFCSALISPFIRRVPLRSRST